MTKLIITQQTPHDSLSTNNSQYLGHVTK